MTDIKAKQRAEAKRVRKAKKLQRNHAIGEACKHTKKVVRVTPPAAKD